MGFSFLKRSLAKASQTNSSPEKPFSWALCRARKASAKRELAGDLRSSKPRGRSSYGNRTNCVLLQASLPSELLASQLPKPSLSVSISGDRRHLDRQQQAARSLSGPAWHSAYAQPHWELSVVRILHRLGRRASKAEETCSNLSL